MKGRKRGAPGAGRRIMVDLVAALAFNATLLGAPFVAAAIARPFLAGEAYGYPATNGAERATLARVERALRPVTPPGPDRTETWAALVDRELAAGEIAVARGLALAAPVLITRADRAGYYEKLSTDADDADRLAAAAGLMPPTLQTRFSGIARAAGGGGEGLFVIGAMSDLVRQSQDWAAGRDVDEFGLVMSGASLVLSEPRAEIAGGAAIVRSGASVAAAAARTGRLNPTFAAHLESLAFTACPPERLRAELTAAFADPDLALDPERAVTIAFERSLDPAAYQRLAETLARIQRLARDTTPSGAAWLLQEARAPEDLDRLGLVAQAAGDRAVALAKLAPGVSVAELAQGSILFTPGLAASMALAALMGAIALFAPFSALRRALKHSADGDAPPTAPSRRDPTFARAA